MAFTYPTPSGENQIQALDIRYSSMQMAFSKIIVVYSFDTKHRFKN